MAKTYINVAYKDREIAKRLGARWDASVRRWYCPPGSTLAKVYGWRKPSPSPSSLSSKADLSDFHMPIPQSPTTFAADTQASGSVTQLSLLG